MHTCDFHAEDWWGVSCCMLASHMLPQDTVVCSLAESVCMLLPSVVCIVCRFPYIYFFPLWCALSAVSPTYTSSLCGVHCLPFPLHILLPSVVCIVCRFPYIYFFAAVAVYLVRDPFFSARSVSRHTHTGHSSFCGGWQSLA